MDHKKKKNLTAAVASKHYFKSVLENIALQSVKLSFCDMNDLFGSNSGIERSATLLKAWHQVAY